MIGGEEVGFGIRPASTRMLDTRTQPARIHHLKAAGVSGAHCLHSFLDDGRETLARRLGSGTHAMLLGKPAALWEEPSQAWMKARDKAIAAGEEPPPVTLAPRSGAPWKAFQSQHAAAVILTRKEWDKAERMASAILADAKAERLLRAPGIIYEQTILWSQLGRARRSTPDARRDASSDGRSFVLEIKTCRSASPFLFGLDAKRFAYHAQLADQREAIRCHTGKAPRDAYIVAVESAPPHVVQVYRLPPALIEQGERLCAQWLERLQMFESTGLWRGYSPRIEDLEFFDRNAPVPVTAPPEFEEDVAID